MTSENDNKPDDAMLDIEQDPPLDQQQQQQDNQSHNVKRGVQSWTLMAICILVAIGTICALATTLLENDEASSSPDASSGVAKKPSQIIGGYQSYENKFPYFVDQGNCGGSLISPKVVITAAHCGPSAYGDKLIIGGYKKGDTGTYGKLRTWSKFVVHPGYYETDFGPVNDFALYHLDEPVTGIYPSLSINQSPSFPQDGTNAVAMGIGVQDQKTGPGMMHGRFLHDVVIPIVNTDECREKLGPSINPDIMMCAGKVGKGVCYGDSGGPLVVRNGNTDILVGVTSILGNLECSKFHEYDNIFARTSGAMNWIKSVVCNEWGEQADFCANSSNPGGGCTDSAGWLDPNGFGCDSYAFTEAQNVKVCEILKNQLGSNGLSPVQACCVCNYAKPNSSQTPNISAGTGCSNYPGWVDPNGYGCDSYELTEAQNVPVCEIFQNQRGTDGKLPGEACCICK